VYSASNSVRLIDSCAPCEEARVAEQQQVYERQRALLKIVAVSDDPVAVIEALMNLPRSLLSQAPYDRVRKAWLSVIEKGGAGPTEDLVTMRKVSQWTGWREVDRCPAWGTGQRLVTAGGEQFGPRPSSATSWQWTDSCVFAVKPGATVEITKKKTSWGFFEGWRALGASPVERKTAGSVEAVRDLIASVTTRRTSETP
jgi:hypothetical protein